MVRIKQNRALSFIIVTLVYILGTGVGIACYLQLPELLGAAEQTALVRFLISYPGRVLVADVLATVFVFAFSVIFGNASVYDPYWSVQPIVILWATVIERLVAGAPVGAASWVLTAAVTLWGVRLTANWAYTFGNLTHQDWRYTMLHDTTGRLYPIVNFTGIHMVPTLVVYFCTIPAAYAIYVNLSFAPLSMLFVAVSVLAVLVQTVSDIEMQAFRRSKVGGFIRTGLWKHSRHPNYLGEILMWWGIGLAVVALDTSLWFGLLGALLNTLLFTFVSIPMAERRQAKKDGFAEYKSQTRVLLPIPKKFG